MPMQDTAGMIGNAPLNNCETADQGFRQQTEQGTVVDLIARKYADGAVVSVTPAERLMNVHNRMKMHDISQLPVIDQGRLVGIIDEYDILLAVANGREDNFHAPVRLYMTTRLETVAPDAAIESALPLLQKGLTAIVKDEHQFYGLITRIDYLSYLKKKVGNSFDG